MMLEGHWGWGRGGPLIFWDGVMGRKGWGGPLMFADGALMRVGVMGRRDGGEPLIFADRGGLFCVEGFAGDDGVDEGLDLVVACF